VRRATHGAAVAAATLALMGCTDSSAGRTQISATPVTPAASAAPGAQPLVGVVTRLEPSVVTITTNQGLGSGVVYRADGVIVTNAHVLGSARQVQVSFADGTQSAGEATGVDDVTDLAVVRVQRTGLPAVTVRQDLPQVAETALAIGSPLGFENTVTEGIISGVGRQIPASDTGGRPLVDLLQTDAAISPGNSGGALIDAQGRLVGINEAYIPPSAGAVSLGFAIPAATVVNVADQLLTTGTVKHPYLGVVVDTLTPDVAQALGVKADAGAVVQQVVAGAPAAKAGIQAGDVIVQFNGKPVRTAGDVYAGLRAVQPGATITIGLNRGGTDKQVQVTLGTLAR
jgi:S1-C subfamily serine protease